MSAFPGLRPDLRPWADWLYKIAQLNGMQPRVTSVYRSLAEQRVLYDRYRRGEARFVAAPPGRSLHNYRLAFDMVVKTPEQQALLGEIWESVGGRWGGRFNDEVHFDSGATIP